MKNYFSIVKFIIPTFLLISFLTISGFLILQWLLIIEYDILDIDEELWRQILPFIFPYIPLIIWLRPRLRVIFDNRSYYKSSYSFLFLAGFTISISLIFFQAYLKSITEKLTELTSIEDIDKFNRTRYYSLKYLTLDTTKCSSYSELRREGKYSYQMKFYFTCPIEIDTLKKSSEVDRHFYGVSIKENIEYLNKEEKDKLHDFFHNQILEKIGNGEITNFGYFENLPKSQEKNNFLKAIQSRNTHEKIGNEANILVLMPSRHKDTFTNELALATGSFLIGLGIILLCLIGTKFNEPELKRYTSGEKPINDSVVNELKFLVPENGHFITSILVNLNIIYFLLITFSGVYNEYLTEDELLYWGANTRNLTLAGEWWRIISCMFLHNSLMHMIPNIFALYLLSILAEPFFSRLNYLIIYLTSGLCGGLVSIWWFPEKLSFGGESGLFGLFGVLLGLLLLKEEKLKNTEYLIYISVILVLYLIFGLTGQNDSASQFGGFTSGSLIGIILYRLDKRRKTNC